MRCHSKNKNEEKVHYCRPAWEQTLFTPPALANTLTRKTEKNFAKLFRRYFLSALNKTGRLALKKWRIEDCVVKDNPKRPVEVWINSKNMI
jgi:hypothetical protein